MMRLTEFSSAWAEWAWAASWQFTLFVGIVAIACLGLRSASPRLRHALWVLAFVKLLLPTTLGAPWSVGNWIPAPALSIPVEQVVTSDAVEPHADGSPKNLITPTAGATQSVQSAEENKRSSAGMWPTAAMIVWTTGVVLCWGVVGWRYRRMSRSIAAMPSIDEGPLRIELERMAKQLNVRRVPELHITDESTSPFLFGLFHPRIVLPRSIVEGFDDRELHAVLLHELMHWRMRDTWIGAAQVAVQGAYWFHPLLWWAGVQLRNERESVCDDAVVRLGSVPPRQYSETIVRVLTSVRGRPAGAGSLVGVFERGSRLQQRLEDVMSFENHRRRFGWQSRALLCGFALLFLPMAGRSADSPQQQDTAQQSSAESPSESASKQEESSDESEAATSDRETDPKRPDPQIVRSVPAVGETGVDSGLTEIRVTFDRDMGKGMSWTGGPPLFPPFDRSRKAEWIDDRTCVLPVTLERGSYYRLGINSTSHQNFKSAEGVPAAPSSLYFVTAGAKQSVEQRVRIPEVVEIEPPNGAADVDPSTRELRVTFNMPMGEGNSWTGGGEHFPTIPNGERPRWSKDGRTCILPVRLAPVHEYQLGLNSLHHINFQSKWGVPLRSVRYEFTTRSK